jgi:hypothetical protein
LPHILSVQFITALLIIAFIGSASAQTSHQVAIDVPKIALIGIAGAGNEQFQIGQGQEAGHRIEITRNRISGIWLNYTSIVSADNRNHKVMAAMYGSLPDALQIVLEASPYTGSGKGKTGMPTGSKVLSSQPAEIISNIGSSFTGKGVNNGHELTYTLQWKNEEELSGLHVGNSSVEIMYTISE